MPRSLHSSDSDSRSGRSVGAPILFASFPTELQAALRDGAARKRFEAGQFLYHRGDVADGFWLIEKGQIKLGHQQEDGTMQALVILGPGDSFGELACLGRFARVLDAEAMGSCELLWISDRQFSKALQSSETIAREMLRILAVQLQEALDNLLLYRNLPASKRLAQRLLALAADRPSPVKLAIRQQELAELIGVSRMTIASVLAELEEQGFVSRRYGHLLIRDTEAMRGWLAR
jgi:CRP/FNR family transcriptional regulator, cyclic AMP receptor protein